jgi:hypothetical protein
VLTDAECDQHQGDLGKMAQLVACNLCCNDIETGRAQKNPGRYESCHRGQPEGLPGFGRNKTDYQDHCQQ